MHGDAQPRMAAAILRHNPSMKAIVALAAMFTIATAQAGEVAWSNSLDSSLATAKKLHKPVMLFMKVEWSAYCTQMRREVFANTDVVKDAKAFLPVMADGDHEGRTIARRYSVTGYPEVLFLDSNGVVIWRASGVLNSADTRKAMASALVALKAYPQYLAKLAKNQKDTASMAQLVLIYAARKDFNAARAMMERAETVDPANSAAKLGAAWNGLGDALQNAMSFNDAREQFEKCARLSKSPSEVAYARASIAACWVAVNRYDEAMKELEGMIASPSTPAKDKAQAQKALDRLKGKSG